VKAEVSENYGSINSRILNAARSCCNATVTDINDEPIKTEPIIKLDNTELKNQITSEHTIHKKQINIEINTLYFNFQ
jgi:hypothetical protein